MGLILRVYKWRHPDVAEDRIPARYRISLWTAFKKPIRKWFSAVFIPAIPFNNLRVSCYRLCGYKIGKGSFIGMRTSIIAPRDITIGAGAIVGAASLVNRSVGSCELVAGVPAKPLHKNEKNNLETVEQ